MEYRKRLPGKRLIQLALNDAVQSRLSLISPIKSQMEKEKRDKRNKNSRIKNVSLQIENSQEDTSLPLNTFTHESRKGAENSVHEVNHYYHLDDILQNVKTTSKHLPSSRHTLYDKNKDSRSMKNNYNPSVPFNSSKTNQDNLTVQSEKPNMTPASAYQYTCRDAKSSTSSDFESSSITSDKNTHRTVPNCQPSYKQIMCDKKSVKVPTIQCNSEFDCNHNLPILSQSCELKESGNSHFNNSNPFSKHEDNFVSEVPKINYYLLQHLMLHSLENSVKKSKRESLSLDNYIPPPEVGNWLNTSEQNSFGNSEIPVSPHKTDQIHSSKCTAIAPIQEQLDRLKENRKSSIHTHDYETMEHRFSSPVNEGSDFVESEMAFKHTSKSDPHYSILKHFQGLILNRPEKHSPWDTITTGNLDLENISDHSQFGDYNIESPISEAHGMGVAKSVWDSDIKKCDDLIDYFLSSNYKSA